MQQGRRTGIEVVSVAAVDDDLPTNGEPFVFEIVSGNPTGEFFIDNTGKISTAGKLVKQARDVYVSQMFLFFHLYQRSWLYNSKKLEKYGKNM